MTQMPPQAVAELNAELTELVEVELPRLMQLVGDSSGDAADQADRHVIETEIGQVETRIERIRLKLSGDPDSAAGAAAGMRLLLDFGSGPERAVLDDDLFDTPADVLRISPDSPAGRAVRAADAGTTVSYRAPNGKDVEVTVLATGDDAFIAA
jgi:transcription elongation factor GreA